MVVFEWCYKKKKKQVFLPVTKKKHFFVIDFLRNNNNLIWQIKKRHSDLKDFVRNKKHPLAFDRFLESKSVVYEYLKTHVFERFWNKQNATYLNEFVKKKKKKQSDLKVIVRNEKKTFVLERFCMKQKHHIWKIF